MSNSQQHTDDTFRPAMGDKTRDSSQMPDPPHNLGNSANTIRLPGDDSGRYVSLAEQREATSRSADHISMVVNGVTNGAPSTPTPSSSVQDMIRRLYVGSNPASADAPTLEELNAASRNLKRPAAEPLSSPAQTPKMDVTPLTSANAIPVASKRATAADFLSSPVMQKIAAGAKNVEIPASSTRGKALATGGSDPQLYRTGDLRDQLSRHNSQRSLNTSTSSTEQLAGQIHTDAAAIKAASQDIADSTKRSILDLSQLTAIVTERIPVALAELDELNTDAANKVRELDDLRTAINEANAKLTKVKTAASAETVQRLSEEIQKLEADKEQASVDLEAIHNHKMALQAEIDSLKLERDAKTKTLKVLEDKSAKLQADIDSSQSNHSKAAEDSRRLRRSVTTLQEQLDKSKRSKTDIDNKCKKAEASLSATQAKKNSMEQAITRLKKEHDGLNKSISEATKKLNKLRLEAQQASTCKPATNTHDTSSSDEGDTTDRAFLRADIEDLERKVAELQNEVEDLENRNEDLVKAIQDKEELLNTKTELLDATSRKVQVKCNELACREAALEKAHQATVSAQAEAALAQNELEMVQSNLNDARTEFSAYTASHAKTKARLHNDLLKLQIRAQEIEASCEEKTREHEFRLQQAAHAQTTDLQASISKEKLELQSTRASITAAKAVLEEHEILTQTKSKELDAIHSKIAKSNKELSMVSSQIAQANRTKQAQLEKLQDVQSDLNAAMEDKEAADMELAKANEAIKASKQQAKARIRRSKSRRHQSPNSSDSQNESRTMMEWDSEQEEYVRARSRSHSRKRPTPGVTTSVEVNPTITVQPEIPQQTTGTPHGMEVAQYMTSRDNAIAAFLTNESAKSQAALAAMLQSFQNSVADLKSTSLQQKEVQKETFQNHKAEIEKMQIEFNNAMNTEAATHAGLVKEALIQEFQDRSMGQADLIQASLEKNNNLYTRAINSIAGIDKLLRKAAEEPTSAQDKADRAAAKKTATDQQDDLATVLEVPNMPKSDTDQAVADRQKILYNKIQQDIDRTNRRVKSAMQQLQDDISNPIQMFLNNPDAARKRPHMSNSLDSTLGKPPPKRTPPKVNIDVSKVPKPHLKSIAASIKNLSEKDGIHEGDEIVVEESTTSEEPVDDKMAPAQPTGATATTQQ